MLCGHQGAVTVLQVCKVFGIVVSGSKDTTVIIWDLNRLAIVCRPCLDHMHHLPHRNSWSEKFLCPGREDSLEIAVQSCSECDMYYIQILENLQLDGRLMYSCSKPFISIHRSKSRWTGQQIMCVAHDNSQLISRLESDNIHTMQCHAMLHNKVLPTILTLLVPKSLTYAIPCKSTKVA